MKTDHDHLAAANRCRSARDLCLEAARHDPMNATEHRKAAEAEEREAVRHVNAMTPRFRRTFYGVNRDGSTL